MSSITPEFIASCKAQCNESPTFKLAQNAMASASTTPNLLDVVVDRELLQTTNHCFSTKLDEWSVTSQKQSGRCWLFAALNLFRAGTMKKLNVKDFEFSQAHLHFFDKFERANHFLTSCIDLADHPVEDRTMAWLLNDPICDGGQWGMAMNLIRKHGLVPKSAYPESTSSSGTLRMNQQLKDILRSSACELRALNDTGKKSEMDAHKQKRLRDIWGILCIHLGTPPDEFDWQWRDKDNNFHRKGKMTPQEFAAEYVTLDWEDMVCLVNDPRNAYYQTYTVDRLQSVSGDAPVIYLNVPTQDMKDITKANLLDGTPVWMGCDVGKQMHRQKGLWDAKLFDFGAFYGCEYGMNKANRLIYGNTLMTHAMLFTGVDIADDGNTLKWRVENSWGEADCGIKGFFTMNDNWYDEHMFEISTPSKYLTEKQRDGLKTTPKMLPAWDPMGSLATTEAASEF
jgi:bleomycin hydrolase